MPHQPGKDDLHVDRLLTNISVAYLQDATEYAAGKVFPTVPVDKDGGIYATYNQNDFFRADAVTKRVDGQESSGSGYRTSSDTYKCDVWSTHKDIGPQALANQNDPYNLNRDSTEWLTQQILIKRERLWTQSYFAQNIWHNPDLQGIAAGQPAAAEFIQFDNFADSDPRSVISTQKIAMKRRSGFMPNTLVLGEEVYEVLKQHPDFEELYKYTQGGIISGDKLAAIFEIPRVIVGGAIEATNTEGAAATYDFIQGKSMWLGYVEPRPALMKPSAGYIFAWTGLLGANAYGGRIRRIPTPLLGEGAYRIEAEMAFDMKVVASAMGKYFFDVID